MKKKAFTLIELVVATALFSILSCFVFNLWDYGRKKTSCGLLEKEVALDLLTRDLMKAEPDIKYWDTEEFVFRVGHADVGWKVNKGRLLRLEGKYFPWRVWDKKTTSMVLKGLAALRVNYKLYGNSVQYVEVEGQQVRLRNG